MALALLEIIGGAQAGEPEKSRRTEQALWRAQLLLCCLLAVGCAECASDREAQRGPVAAGAAGAAGGAEAAATALPATAPGETSKAAATRRGSGTQAAGSASAAHSPLARLRAAKRGELARPRPLPTFLDFDWKAFPSGEASEHGSSGRVIEVRPGGPGVLARALERAKAGDVIEVHQGTYHEGLASDDAALRVRKEGIVIRARPGGRARIVPRDGQVKRGILVEASHVMLSGLELDGFLLGIGLGRQGSTLRNLVLSDLSVSNREASEWSDGIIAWPDHRAGGRTVVEGLLLRDVTITGAALGLSCNGGPCRSWWLENVVVRSASGSGSGADAIAVESGDSIVLVNVDVSGATGDGIDIKASRALVMNSHVHRVRRNGIKLWRGGDIVNTIVEHTGADASYVFDTGRFRILNSIMAFHNYRGSTSYNLSAGYGVSEPLEVELTNSIFYKTSGGMYFSDRTKLRINNCIFYRMENGAVLRAVSRGREVHLATSDSPRRLEELDLGRGNLFVDPRFVAADRGDFRLHPESPAVDQGIVTGRFPDLDMVGNPRVRGKAPDIGPLELH